MSFIFHSLLQRSQSQGFLQLPPAPPWFVRCKRLQNPLLFTSTGTLALQSPDCLPAPCDQPWMAPNHLLLLAEWFNGNSAKIIFLWPQGTRYYLRWHI